MKISSFQGKPLHCSVCGGNQFLDEEGTTLDTYTCCCECGATGPISAFIQANVDKETERVAKDLMARAKKV